MSASTVPRPLGTAIFPFFPMSAAIEEAFINELWPLPRLNRHISNFAAYFYFLNQTFRETDPGQHAITTYDDIIFIINVLRETPSLTLDDLVKKIQSDGDGRGLSSSPENLIRSIQLVLGLWLMLDIRHLDTFKSSERWTSISWPLQRSLTDVLKNSIRQYPTHPTAMFPETMNLYDMGKIAGFRVQWTSNLALHLSMRGLEIFIFHDVSILRRMRDSCESLETPFLPLDFIEETLATIDLLVPITRDGCNKWLGREIDRQDKARDIVVNMRGRKGPETKKSRYPYWQEELSLIEETFGRTSPRNFFQWWHDRRNSQQWWGFWLVVVGIFLTVLFGLIQSITGILQVIKSG